MNLFVLVIIVCFPIVEFFALFGYLTRGPLPMYSTVISLLMLLAALVVGGVSTLVATIPVVLLMFVYAARGEETEREPNIHAVLAKQEMVGVSKLAIRSAKDLVSAMGAGVMRVLAIGGVIMIALLGVSLIVYAISVLGWGSSRLTKETDTNPVWAVVHKLGWSFPHVDEGSDIIMTTLAILWRWFRTSFADALYSVLTFTRIVLSVVTPAWNFGLDYVQESIPRFYDTFRNCSGSVLDDTQLIIKGVGAGLTAFTKPFANSTSISSIYPEQFRPMSKAYAEALSTATSIAKRDVVCYCDNLVIDDLADIVFFEPHMTDTFESLFQNVTSVFVTASGGILRLFPPYNENPLPTYIGPDGTLQHVLGITRSIGCIIDRWIFLVLRHGVNLVALTVDAIIPGLETALPLYIHEDEVPVTGVYTMFIGWMGYLLNTAIHIPYAVSMFLFDSLKGVTFDVKQYNMHDRKEEIEGVFAHFASALFWVLDKVRLFLIGHGDHRPLDIGVSDATCQEEPANFMFMFSCFWFEYFKTVSSLINGLLGFFTGFLAVTANVVFIVQHNQTYYSPQPEGFVHTFSLFASETATFFEQSVAAPWVDAPVTLRYTNTTPGGSDFTSTFYTIASVPQLPIDFIEDDVPGRIRATGSPAR